jgi:UDP-glucose 4-epimerase
MKTVLITGGSGFIGRNLVEALETHYNILAPRHAELDLLDFKALLAFVQKNKVDIIIHAAVHVPMVNGAEKEYYTDMVMFLNIERISHLVEKILYFGSGAEFDKRFDIRMVVEEDIGKSIPVSEYGLAKYTMNMLAKRSENMYNLRLFGIFGKYELWSIKFLSNLCCKAAFDLPLTVRSDCYFDFLFIEDLPSIVRWFIENAPKHHDYNVCHGAEFLLTQLAEMVKKASKKDLPIVLLSPERNLDYSAHNLRLHGEMGSLHITDMAASLLKLYHYYASNRSKIDVALLKVSC